MRSSILHKLLIAAAVLPLALATSSLAQDRPDGERMHAMEHRDPAAMAEAHAQRLRDALQLRPDQEGALRAFLDSMTPPQGAMDRMREDRDEDARLTTPQRLDRMLAHLDEMRQRLAAHADAAKRFYAQLSPSQQKAFDALGPVTITGWAATATDPCGATTATRTETMTGIRETAVRRTPDARSDRPPAFPRPGKAGGLAPAPVPPDAGAFHLR